MPDALTSTTWLFTPGDRPDRFGSATGSGADEVILDLEDAVAPAHKPVARQRVVRWLTDHGSAWVRVNAEGTPWHTDDVDAVLTCPGLRGLVVPKAESPAALAALGSHLGGRGLVALIESARGMRRADDIADCAAVTRLAFGSIDFAADIDAIEGADSLLLARSTLVLASRVAGKPAPLDGVTTTLNDAGVVREAARRARRLGFGGKLCIHPAQLEPVERAFRPTDNEIAWARRVVTGAGSTDGAAASLDGSLIDRPVLDRARRILSKSGHGA